MQGLDSSVAIQEIMEVFRSAWKQRSFLDNFSQYFDRMLEIEIGSENYVDLFQELAVAMRSEILGLFQDIGDLQSDRKNFALLLIDFWKAIIWAPLKDGKATLATIPFRQRLMDLAYDEVFGELKVV